MKNGDKYRLSQKGVEAIKVLEQIRREKITGISTNIFVTVIGDENKCRCGSVNSKHTEDCPSLFREMILDCGIKVWLSKEEVVLSM